MYSYDTRVSFSKVDAEENLTINAVVDYFQDASTFHSEDIGLGYDYLKPRNLIWVLNTWQIDVIRMPKYLERIKVCTIPYKFRGFLGYRNFYIENEAGEMLVKANSMWSLLDITSIKPVRPEKEMLDGYGEAEALEMDYCNGKLRLPDEIEQHKPVTVERHFLDPNHHMNNGQYVNLAGCYIPDNLKIKRLRAEYRNQAFLGDIIYPVSGENEPGKYTVSLNDAEGKPYSVVEFTAEQ